MKNHEIVNLYTVLNTLLAEQKSLPTKFAYRVARNVALLKPIVEAFNEAVKVDKVPELAAFEKDRIESLEKVCAKDETGAPITDNGRYTFNDTSVLQNLLDDVRSRHPGIEAKIEEYNRHVQELSEDDEDVKILKVSESELPPELPGNTIVHLLPMIED